MQSSSQLLAVVLRILKQHDRAEDVLQEVFVKVWNSAGRYNPQLGTPMAWMMTIARNRAIDHLRRHGRAPLSTQLMDVESRASSDPGPLEITLDLEQGRALERCLDRLEDGQRSSILLAYLDGYTHQEIAQRLGSPLGTIKSWIRRGQINLKRCLES
jgi:RNA polymerase sigma-70 factor (ECF subfamily)